MTQREAYCFNDTEKDTLSYAENKLFWVSLSSQIFGKHSYIAFLTPQRQPIGWVFPTRNKELHQLKFVDRASGLTEVI